MYTVARCMDTCGKPLGGGRHKKTRGRDSVLSTQALGPATSVRGESFRFDKEFGKNWTETGDSRAILDGPQRCRSNWLQVGMRTAVEVIQHNCVTLSHSRPRSLVAKRSPSQPQAVAVVRVKQLSESGNLIMRNLKFKSPSLQVLHGPCTLCVERHSTRCNRVVGTSSLCAISC